MKKLKLLFCCIPIFLTCGMYYSVKPIIIPSKIVIPRVQSSAGYWLYFRLEDRLATLPREAAGRSKKGDLVQTRPVTPTNRPSVKEQQEWGIIRVDSISARDIETYTSAWDTVIVGRDTTLAYRRWIFDVDNLSISKGLDTTKVPWTPIKTQSIRKTSAMLLEYERKCKIIRYQQYVIAPLEKILNWVVRPLFATEQISTCNLPGQDYDTIVLWEDAEDGAMTTGNPDVLEVSDDDGILTNSTRVDINGWTNNDATTQIIVRTATGEQHTSTDSTGFQRENTGSTTESILVQENYTIIKGLDLNHGNSNTRCVWLLNGSNLTLEDCLIWNGDNIGIDLASGADANFLIQNNVIYEFSNSSNSRGISIASTALGEVYHNTVYNVGNVGIYAIYSGGGDSTTFSNNASFDNAGANNWDFLSAGGNTLFKVGSTNNCSSDNSADAGTLSNGIENETDTNNFTDPSAPARDFSVLDNTAAIYNAGVDLSGTVDFDIIATSRPQATTYDIGAFELIVVAAVTRRKVLF